MSLPDRPKFFAESSEISIQEKLKETLKKCERLHVENEKLRERLGFIYCADFSPQTPQPSNIEVDQIAIFKKSWS